MEFADQEWPSKKQSYSQQNILSLISIIDFNLLKFFHLKAVDTIGNCQA